MIDFKQALRDPSGVYHYPKDLLQDESLTVEQKLALLAQWELDARELAIAEEENMAGDGPSMLSRVHRAIGIIKGEIDPDTPLD